jgi:hypothetical protein
LDEQRCVTCDCGEPCEEPVRVWALRSAPAAVREQVLHSLPAAAALHERVADSALQTLPDSAELPFQTTAALLLRCAFEYHQPRVGSLVFADLGSSGKAFNQALGWLASEHLAEREPAFRNVALSLQHGDALSESAVSTWQGADVVLLHAPLDSQLFADASSEAAQRLRPGAMLLTVGGPPTGAEAQAMFQLVERRRLMVSWGMGTLFLSRRLETADGAGGWPLAQDEDESTALLRSSGALDRLATLLRSAAETATQAATALVVSHAVRSELCARLLVARGVLAPLSVLLDAEAVHHRACAALALCALAQQPGVVAGLHEHALPALVRTLVADRRGPGEDALLAAAASALADVAGASGEAAHAVVRAGAVAPLQRLASRAAEDGLMTAAAAAETALARLTNS